MANEDQARFWNEEGGPNWVANEARIDMMLAPFGLALLASAAPQPGEHVLDIGCGFGTTTFDMARAVGEQGRVVAVDVSEAMIARLRSRVAAEMLTNAIGQVADAQTDPLPFQDFHLAVSRFGVMFFDDPPGAFANIRAAIRPGGRLAFTCWQPLAVNEFMAAPLEAMKPVIGAVDPPAPGDPGPFGLSDESFARRLLDGAGFADVAFTPVEGPVVIGGDEGIDGAVEHTSFQGPTRRALARLDPDQRDAAMALLREMLSCRIDNGRVVFEGRAWVVTARA